MNRRTVTELEVAMAKRSRIPEIPNALLASLPRGDLEKLCAGGTLIELPMKRILHEPGELAPDVLFPASGVISLLTVLDDGSAVEIATVGNEGMVDLAAYLGMESHARWLVQVPGSALQIPAAHVRKAAAESESILKVLHEYMLAMFVLVSQTAACNRRHPVEERTARWLLMTHDRVESDLFPMTHEFLADMLGVRRPSVSIAMGMLQKAGFINYRRGRVEVVDREGMEQAACECYHLLAEQFAHRFPLNPEYTPMRV
jgi:CRP-like cAMP-binding protein